MTEPVDTDPRLELRAAKLRNSTRRQPGSVDPLDQLQASVAADGGPTFGTWLEKAEWLALAWSGEVGEACNEVKKIRRDDGGTPTPERSEKLRAELVDSVVYLLVLLHHLGVPASTVPGMVRAAHDAYLARADR